MTVDRQPAIRRPNHPAADLPTRTSVAATTTPPPVGTAPSDIGGGEERLTETHNVRIKPSTKKRLSSAVDKLRYETGDRSISISSLTDLAIDEYLQRHGC